MFKLVIGNKRQQMFNCCRLASTKTSIKNQHSSEFETVFSFPSVKYFAIFHRLKVYHFTSCAIALPSCGLLEALTVVPESTFLTASYIGITGASLLSLSSLPLRNIIGFIYVSKDNKKIKISSVNFWGKRIDQAVSANDWVPLMDLKPKVIDVIYLSPKLNDGTVYKLFLRFGKVTNGQKMAEVIE